MLSKHRRGVRDLREDLRHRAFVMALQNRVKNKIHRSVWKIVKGTGGRPSFLINSDLNIQRLRISN
jgi:hypothetical protein